MAENPDAGGYQKVHADDRRTRAVELAISALALVEPKLTAAALQVALPKLTVQIDRFLARRTVQDEYDADGNLRP